MFDAPGRPFTEGVIAPVPAVFFKEGDGIPEPLFRTGGIVDDTEFPDQDFQVVLLREADDLRETEFQAFPIIIGVAGDAGIVDPELIQNPLMCVFERSVEVW